MSKRLEWLHAQPPTSIESPASEVLLSAMKKTRDDKEDTVKLRAWDYHIRWFVRIEDDEYLRRPMVVVNPRDLSWNDPHPPTVHMDGYFNSKEVGEVTAYIGKAMASIDNNPIERIEERLKYLRREGENRNAFMVILTRDKESVLDDAEDLGLAINSEPGRETINGSRKRFRVADLIDGDKRLLFMLWKKNQ